MAKVIDYLNRKAREDGGILLVLFDPPKQPPEVAGKLARVAQQSGADVILVGGSVGAQGELLDSTLIEVKKNSDLPVVLFPGGAGTVSSKADAVYFQSLINSRNPYWVSHLHITAAPHVKSMGLETIATTYIVIEPGGAVGWVGDANLVPRDKPYLAAHAALAGKYFGTKLVILESGSGSPTHAPVEMVRDVRKELGDDVLLFVAGGVKTPESAYELIKAGADGIHIGTVIESSFTDLDKCKAKIKALSAAIKKAGKEKLALKK
ncbi:MAG TPA: geranylgeranylglyceryl/heptaprenylglyceryl phosphate synthase [archaeon]|nr:geranylgeranylglyceryl/heptaprenylglyceryl phosphate synthase [archaeon]